jgi:hypothetical protein
MTIENLAERLNTVGRSPDEIDILAATEAVARFGQDGIGR